MSSMSSPLTYVMGSGQPIDMASLPHDTQQPNIIASAIATWLIAFLFVGMRFYTRVAITHNRMSGSEWCIISSLIFSLGNTISAIMQAQYGFGVHIWDLTPKNSDPVASAQWGWISLIFYALSLLFSKLAILLLYMCLFKHSCVHKASYWVLSIVVLSHVWIFYTIFTACVPLQAYWDPSVAPATCHPMSFFLASQGIGIVSDFVIFVLPIPVVAKLNVQIRQKLILLWLFALGFFVCFISVLRIILLAPLLANPGPDPTYSGTPVFHWTNVEVNAAIVVGCAMTLKPLVSRVMPKMLSGHPYKNQQDSEETPRDSLVTFGATSSRPPPRNHIRVDSAFTAEIMDKADEQMASLNKESFDLQGRQMQNQDPYTPGHSFHNSNGSNVSARAKLRV